MRKLVLLFAFLLSVLMAPPRAAAAEPAREYIIVSGGVSLWAWEKYKAQPHDNWWMNFVRAARIRIEEIKTQNPEAEIAWLVFRPSYLTRSKQEGKDLMGFIDSVRDAYHVKLVYFDRTEQLIQYLNYGRPREMVKIANLEYFGHSNKACFMFDYSNNIDSASKVWLHEDDLKKIQRGIFARDAFVKSWGCHTGESMSSKFKSATGVKMIGANGKTAYQTHELPIVSTPGGYWTR